MTYKLKLIDFKTKTSMATFGTCELCMGTSELVEGVFVFETSRGKVIEVTNGRWDWGDYDTIVNIENTADFAHWLSQQEFEGKPPEHEWDIADNLRSIVDSYDEHNKCQRYTQDFEVEFYSIDFQLEFDVDNGCEQCMPEDVREFFVDNVASTPGVKILQGAYQPYSNASGCEQDKEISLWSYDYAAKDRQGFDNLVNRVYDLVKQAEDKWDLTCTSISFEFYNKGAHKYFDIPQEEISYHIGSGDYPNYEIINCDFI